MHQKQVTSFIIYVLVVYMDIIDVNGQSVNPELCRRQCDSQQRFYQQFITSTAYLQNLYKTCTARCAPVPVPVPDSVTRAATIESTRSSTTTTSTLSTTTTLTKTSPTILPTVLSTTTSTVASTMPTTARSTFIPTTIRSSLALPSTVLTSSMETSSSTTTRKNIDEITTNTSTPTPSVTSTTAKTFECGIQKAGVHNHRQRIVGGTTAAECEYPWLAFISILSQVCAGAILDSRHVLTAAHCVTTKRTSREVLTQTVHVRVGSSSVSLAKVYSVVNITIHPQYNPWNMINDAAILTVSGDFEFSDCISTICLPEVDSEPTEADFCVVAGWGTTAYGTSGYVPNLLEVELSIVNQRMCQGSYGMDRVNDRTLCAGDYYSGGIDSCQGDSGAPFMCRRQGRFFVHGIVSNGDNCAQRFYPGIYTRVGHPQIRQFISMATGAS